MSRLLVAWLWLAAPGRTVGPRAKCLAGQARRPLAGGVGQPGRSPAGTPRMPWDRWSRPPPGPSRSWWRFCKTPAGTSTSAAERPRALGRIGPEAAPAVAALIEALDSELVSVRRNSVAALGHLGPAARAAVPRLIALVGDEDPAVRAGQALSLWQIDHHARAVPTLVDMLQQPQGASAYQAAVALGRIGPEAHGAALSLVAALGHVEADARRAAARSLGQIQPKRDRHSEAGPGEPGAGSPSRTQSKPWVGSARRPCPTRLRADQYQPGSPPHSRQGAGPLGSRGQTGRRRISRSGQRSRPTGPRSRRPRPEQIRGP